MTFFKIVKHCKLAGGGKNPSSESGAAAWVPVPAVLLGFPWEHKLLLEFLNKPFKNNKTPTQPKQTKRIVVLIDKFS